jgi:hypothetical protein
MTEPPSDLREQLPQALGEIWGLLMRTGQFHGALLTSLAGYVTAVELKNAELETHSLRCLFKAVDELREKLEGRPDPAGSTCSFCGASRAEVRLVGGPDVFICGACAKRAGDALER